MMPLFCKDVDPTNWALHMTNSEPLHVFLPAYNNKWSGVYGQYRGWWWRPHILRRSSQLTVVEAMLECTNQRGRRKEFLLVVVACTWSLTLLNWDLGILMQEGSTVYICKRRISRSISKRPIRGMESLEVTLWGVYVFRGVSFEVWCGRGITMRRREEIPFRRQSHKWIFYTRLFLYL